MLVVVEIELGPPNQHEEHEKIEVPHEGWPVKPPAGAIVDSADERSEQMRHSEPDNDRNEDREIGEGVAHREPVRLMNACLADI